MAKGGASIQMFDLSTGLSIFMPPLSGGLDLDSRSSGCARLGGGVAPSFGILLQLLPTAFHFFYKEWRHP